MATFEITGPDGGKFRVTAPEGATEEQVLSYARANMGGQQQAAQQPMRPVAPPIDGIPYTSPEYPNLTPAPPSRADMTRDSRGQAVAIGGAAGAVLGAPLGPAGMVGAGALGAAGGGLFHDVLSDAQQAVGAIPEQYTAPTPRERLTTAAEEGVTDLAFGTALPAIGAAVGIGKRGLENLAGVGPAERQLAKEGMESGVRLGIAEISRRPVIQGAAKILGRFPFIGTPFKQAAERRYGDIFETTGERISAQDRLFERLGPISDEQTLSKAMKAAGDEKFKLFRNEANRRYDIVRSIGRDAGEVIPAEPVRESALQGLATYGERALPGLPEGAPVRQEIIQYLQNTAERLPERLTFAQLEGQIDTIESLITRARGEGLEVSSLMRMKRATEEALRQADDPQLVGALRDADDYFSKSMSLFESPSGQRFGRIEKNAFNLNLSKPGTMNEDELFRTAWNAKSATAMRDLRELVGKDTFNQGLRLHFDNAMDTALKANPEAPFKADAYRQYLGLESTKSPQYGALREALRGTGIAIDDVRRFADITEKALATGVPDVSTFVARRAMLGGMGSAVRSGLPLLSAGAAGGAAGAAGGAASIPAALVGAAIMRYGASVLAKPYPIKLMSKAIDPATSPQVAQNLIVRLMRYLPDEGEEMTNDPTQPQQPQAPGPIGIRQ